MTANTERSGISPSKRITNKERRESSGNINRDKQVDKFKVGNNLEVHYYCAILMVYLKGRLNGGDYFVLSLFVYWFESTQFRRELQC